MPNSPFEFSNTGLYDDRQNPWFQSSAHCLYIYIYIC